MNTPLVYHWKLWDKEERKQSGAIYGLSMYT